MKKLFILTLATVFVLSANAQILRNIARSAGNTVVNSAENRASDEVNKKVDKGVNKFFDSLVKEDTTATKENPATEPAQKKSGGDGDQPPASMSKFMKSMGVSTEEIPHKAEYKFTGQIVMTLEATDENGKKASSSEYVTCFNEKNSDAMFKMKAQENNSTTSTIIDQENLCMLMLTESEGSKTGFATKFDPNSAQKTQMPETPNEPETKAKAEDECTPTKTGKTKSISGYNCSEYRCEDKEGIVIVWITKDFSANNNKLFSQNAMGMKYKTDGFEGMVMQYETYSKTDKSSSIMTIKSIDMSKSSSFSTAGYQISGFNFGAKKK